MFCISILSKRFGILMSRSRGTSATVARSVASNWSMRSAAALAVSSTGIDCTRPKQAPTTNISAVVVLVSEAPPSVALNCGATNTTAPSSTYIETCEVTISLKVSAWLLILMLAAVRETSTASSYRSSLRAVLSLISLKPSRKSVSRSNSRRSHSAACCFSAARRLFLKWKIDAGGGDDDDGDEDRRQRQERHVDRHEEDEHRALDGKGEQVARLRQHRGVAGDRGDDARAPDALHRPAVPSAAPGPSGAGGAYG